MAGCLFNVQPSAEADWIFSSSQMHMEPALETSIQSKKVSGWHADMLCSSVDDDCG